MCFQLAGLSSSAEKRQEREAELELTPVAREPTLRTGLDPGKCLETRAARSLREPVGSVARLEHA